MKYKIIQGNCLEKLKELPENSVDSIVTDPPYELGFMGKSWDSTGIANNPDLWREVLRVLKPGGHLLAFSGTRTYHRMAVAIEDAGFEVRDMIEWVYGSGFPKSLNIGKAVDKIAGETGRKEKFTEWMRTTGITTGEINKITDSFMGSHYLTTKEQPAIPTSVIWAILRPHIKTEIPQWVDKLVERIEREREVVGKQTNIANKSNDNTGRYNWNTESQQRKESIDITKGTTEWEGWGTALKPSHESIMVAQKPLDSNYDIEYNIGIISKNILLCLSQLFAKTAENNLELNQKEQTPQDIAQWLAENNINTQEDLSEAMDMLPLKLMESLNLNIVLSWLNILADLWRAMNTPTIKMELNLITELKILKSMEWENIFQSITQAKNSKTDGLNASVLNVENLLNAVWLKLNYTLTHFAQENVISQGKRLNFAPNHEPICMARKPLAEKTVAENVLKYGTGGINIDESRVGSEKIIINGGGGGEGTGWGKKEEINEERIDRFPANLIHDNSEEVRECFPETKSVKSARGGNKTTDETNAIRFGSSELSNYECGFNDSGNASRFFKSIIYQAKASKSERNNGCEDIEEIQTTGVGGLTADFREDGSLETASAGGKYGSIKAKQSNSHPTVKPIALMEYLIKIVTPKGGIVLDPFMGSGSTGVAAKKNGYDFIGIELNAEYIKIAEERIRNTPEKLL